MCPYSRFLLILYFCPEFSLHSLLPHLTLIGLFVASFSPAPLLGFELKKKMAEKGRGSSLAGLDTELKKGYTGVIQLCQQNDLDSIGSDPL